MRFDLSEQERSADLTCQRASLEDGQSVLELGCGWGSVCLYIARRYPSSSVTAVSNSKTQREFIQGQCQLRGISNLTVLTADVATFTAPAAYDRIVSVEMFEHMKNYQAGELLAPACWQLVYRCAYAPPSACVQPQCT